MPEGDLRMWLKNKEIFEGKAAEVRVDLDVHLKTPHVPNKKCQECGRLNASIQSFEAMAGRYLFQINLFTREFGYSLDEDSS